jgi:hypothetical protein
VERRPASRQRPGTPPISTAGAGADDADVRLGQELAHPNQLVDAAGAAPDSRGPRGADAVGDARAPRPEDVALPESTGTPDAGADDDRS